MAQTAPDNALQASTVSSKYSPLTLLRKAVNLTLITGAAIGMVIGLHGLLGDKIDAAKLHAFHSQIISADQYDNTLSEDTLAIDENFREFLGLVEPSDRDRKIHIARNNGQALVAIIPTNSLEGYNSAIKMLLGINRDGSIAGLRVIEHTETPGLADYIDARKSDWILSFNGKIMGSDFGERQVVNKERGSGKYDSLTGATITRKAIIRQVKKTLSYYQITQPLAVP